MSTPAESSDSSSVQSSDSSSLLDSLVQARPPLTQQPIPKSADRIRIAVGYAFEWTDVRDFLITNMPDNPIERKLVVEYYDQFHAIVIRSMEPVYVGVHFHQRSAGSWHGDSIRTGPQLLDWYRGKSQGRHAVTIDTWFITKAKKQNVIGAKCHSGNDHFYWIIYNPDKNSTFVIKKQLENSNFFVQVPAAPNTTIEGAVSYYY